MARGWRRTHTKSESVLELDVISEGPETVEGRAHTELVLDIHVLSSDVELRAAVNSFRLAVLWSCTSNSVLFTLFDSSLQVEDLGCTS